MNEKALRGTVQTSRAFKPAAVTKKKTARGVRVTAQQTSNHRTRVGIARRLKTRARILEASVAVFADSANESTVIDDFARHAGVSRGTFYNHFRTTAELFDATIEWLSSDLARAVSLEYHTIKEADLRLASGIYRYLRWAMLHPRWCVFISKVPQVSRRSQQRLTRDLREGHRLGLFTFSHLEVAQDLVIGMPTQAIRRLATADVQPDQSEEIVATIMLGLGVRTERLRKIMQRLKSIPRPCL